MHMRRARIDGGSLVSLVALENDINLTMKQGGPTFMAGSQVIYSAGPNQGHLQLWVSNNWVDTGIDVGLFVPYTWNRMALDIALAADSFSFVSYTRNGIEYPLPAAFQNVPGQSLDWGPTAQVYVQEDLGPGGGLVSQASRNIGFQWFLTAA